MIIPGYEAVKVQIVEDHGSITIYQKREGESDLHVFTIHSDGTMDLSQEVQNEALLESGVDSA